MTAVRRIERGTHRRERALPDRVARVRGQLALRDDEVDQAVGNGVLTAHYIHNELLETIEDIGYLNAEGSEGYVIGNPGRGLSALQFPSGGTPLGFATPKPVRQYDALELGYNKRFANNWFFSAN